MKRNLIYSPPVSIITAAATLWLTGCSDSSDKPALEPETEESAENLPIEDENAEPIPRGIPEAFNYGLEPIQVADLWLPEGDQLFPVAILIHGGFWQSQFDRSLMTDLAKDLNERGAAVWNIDYRSIGNGGGWPETFEDVATAIDFLAEVSEDRPLDLDRVVTIGHSAGGTLALWAAARADLPKGAPGHLPEIKPDSAISLAGVNDLVGAAEEGLGGGAVVQLFGLQPNTENSDERYLLASPLSRLPMGVPQLLVHGGQDFLVPPAQSRNYFNQAESLGDEITLEFLPEDGHFEAINPSTDYWKKVIQWLIDEEFFIR